MVVDVASARRSHGRLAALYRPGHGAMGDEAAMLAAYAGHAAAALDLLIALEDSRQEADRASALLSLAHELSTADGAAKVCDVVTEALPRIVGCSSAGILLWDPPPAGSTPRRRSVSTRTGSRSCWRPRSARRTPPSSSRCSATGSRGSSARRDSSAVLQDLLAALGLADVVAVPCSRVTTFLGVATASWRPTRRPRHLRGDALARLRGVGDQASTALQNARLLETVRHQASHDSLTGLPNRVLFLDRLESALAEERAPTLRWRCSTATSTGSRRSTTR